jgi:hypothetical protein
MTRHLLVFLACLALSGGARALTLQEWRGQVETMRVLAERDVQEAYQRATQLAEDVPLGATPVDRARALNALARAEVTRSRPCSWPCRCRTARARPRPTSTCP